MKLNTAKRRRSANGICVIPFAALCVATASGASPSWTYGTEAVWSTGGDWMEETVPVVADLAVFDAASSPDLKMTIGVEFSDRELVVMTSSGLIMAGGVNTLTLGGGAIDMSGGTQGRVLNALLALVAEQSRNAVSERTMKGAGVNLCKIGSGELTLSSGGMVPGTPVIEDGRLSVSASLTEKRARDFAFAEFYKLNIGAAVGVSPRLEAVRFRGERSAIVVARNGGKRTVKISTRTTGAKDRGLASGEVLRDFTASLKLQHGNGPMTALEGVVLGDTGVVRDLNLRAADIATAENRNSEHQYTLTRLTPQVSPPSFIPLSISFTFGYGTENANGSGPGAVSNFWNHVDAYPMPNTSLQFNDVPPPPAPALHSNSYWLNGANRGNNTFRFAAGHMTRNIGRDKFNLTTLASDGSTLATAMTFSYDDPATIGAFAHNGSYGSGPVIEAGAGTQPYNQRQLRWTASGDSGGSISYFEFANIPVEMLGGAYNVFLEGSGYTLPALINLTSPTFRLATPGNAGTLRLAYIQFVAAPVSVFWTGASSPTQVLWSNLGNFSTDFAGEVPRTEALSNINDVIFNATDAVNFAGTILDVDALIKTLKFNASAASSVGIGGTNTMTIAPTSSLSGVTVESLSGNHTISTKIALGANQTWTVTDANQFLTASGVISGGFTLTKAGAGKLVLTGVNTYTGATIINAGTLQLGDGGTTGSISLQSILTNNGVLAVNRSNTTTQGVDFDLISGTGGFTQAGSGITNLSLANTYTGVTKVESGILNLLGSITSDVTVNAGTLVVSGTITGSTTVNNGGKLAGINSTGMLGSVTLNSGGMISPGTNGTGLLNTETLTFANGSIFEFEIDTSTPDIDVLNVTGDLNIGLGVMFNAVNLGTALLNEGDPIPPIIDYTGTWNGGTFQGLPDNSIITIGANHYQISYDGLDGMSSEVTLSVVSIPEPGSVVSLFGGIGLLLGLRRRQVSMTV